jgi:superfamily I DNA/RNA helicase
VLSEGPFQADAADLAQVRERLATGNPAPPMLVEIAGRYRGLAPADFFARWQREYGRVEDEDLGLLCQMARGAASLEEFLRRVLLGRGTDHERRGGPGGPASEAVGLLTLHAAKGLEYPVVFICGVEDGLVPHGEDKVDLDEERRLLYVGMTRAREELVLLRARTRTRYGERVQTRLSPFVSEMAGELLVREEVNPPPSRRGDGQLSLF